jgi:sugar lactone lactonase YvrE
MKCSQGKGIREGGKRAMKIIRKQSAGWSHRLRAWATVAALTGFALGLSTQGALAQNAAQRAALARMSLARSGARPEFMPPSGTVEAANISLDLPGGLAFDAAGDLFIADTGDNVILEVNLDGLVSTVAGAGTQGFGGDGGAATGALLDSPAGVAVDSSGNIYIADTHNNRIREVSGGNISTIAGTGVAGFSGDGAAATAALLSYPTAVAVDSSGNVYIADTNNHRIREIAGTTINTVAGNGSQTYSGDGGLATAAGLDSPNGVAVDAAFNIYIGDTHNQRVRLVTLTTGIITTLAGTGVKGFNGDGPATTSELARPRGVAVGAPGTVYVADSDNNRIRAISGAQVTTIAGNGSQGDSGDSGASTSAALDTPRSVAFEGSALVFSDTLNQAVRSASGGTVNTLAGASANSAESLVLGGATTTVYGTGTSVLTATFANGAKTATGQVSLYDGLGSSPALVGTSAFSANTAVFSTVQINAGAHDLVATYPGDANNPAIASGVYVLLVTQAPSNTSLTTTNATFILGTPLTLTATVASASGAPTGAVNFYDGATLLNSTPVALSGGVATLTLAALPLGAQSLTAVYSGDTNFLTSASTAVAENVITPDFSITSSPPAQAVLPASSVNYTITLTPLNPTFVYPLTLSASGLPSGVTASFNPSSIAAGAGTSSTVLTLTASAQARMEMNHRFPGRMIAPAALALLILPLAFSRRARRTSRKLSRSRRALLALLLMAGLSVLAGCGGGGFFSHPTQSYTVTVTAANGINTHSTNVTLTVQ